METIKTHDLSIFKTIKENRDLSKPDVQTHIKALMKSLQLNNMLDMKPILVDANMAVIDGQCRLEAAKRLGIHVYYQVKRDAKVEDILLLQTQKQWIPQDFIHYHEKAGNEHYKKLVAFAKRMNVDTFEVGCFLLGYRNGNNSNGSICLRKGNFIFPNDDTVREVADRYEKLATFNSIIEAKMMGNKAFLKGKRFRSGVLYFVSNPLVNFDVFQVKLVQRIEFVRPCAIASQLQDMLKAIYNYRNQDPLP